MTESRSASRSSDLDGGKPLDPGDRLDAPEGPNGGERPDGAGTPGPGERPAGEERLVVALVRGVHGLRGAVRVEVLTDRPAERFRPGSVLHPEGSDTALTIASASPIADGPGWRLVFREVPDRTGAERLRGAYLEVVPSPHVLGRGEYFWHEVIDATVRDVDGHELGLVRDIYRVGETEVLVVGGGPYGEFDVPVVRSLIRIFAPRRGEIVVDAAALDLGSAASRGDDEARPRAPRRRSRRPGPSSGDRQAPPAGSPGSSGDAAGLAGDAGSPAPHPPASRNVHEG